MSELSPSQSADVIKWQHDSMNREARENGWNDKYGIGYVAVKCSSSTKLPRRSGVELPLLNPQEARDGLNFLTGYQGSDEPDTDYEEIQRLVDQGIACAADARKMVKGE